MATRRYKRILTPAELAGPVELEGEEPLIVAAARNLRRPARFRGPTTHPERRGTLRSDRTAMPATPSQAPVADG